MRAAPYSFILVFAGLLSTSSCAAVGQGRYIDRTLYFCRLLAGPDADKGEGEIWFGLQSERAEASRNLWSKRGVKAIDERLATTKNQGDRECLDRLRKEAESHQLIYD